MGRHFEVRAAAMAKTANAKAKVIQDILKRSWLPQRMVIQIQI
mgnify:CR=1 FL=1